MNMGAADLNIGQGHNDVDLYPLLAKGKGVQTTQLKSNPKKPGMCQDKITQREEASLMLSFCKS